MGSLIYPYTIKSLGAVISGDKGFNLKKILFSADIGYSTGVKNIRNVVSNDTIFTVSLKTPLTRDKIKDKPNVKIRIGISARGKNMMVHEGTNLNTKKNITIKLNFIKNSNIDWATDENTKVSNGKLVLEIMLPADTMLLQPEIMPVENNCHTVRPINANKGYGISVEAMFRIPALFKNMNVPIATKGIINAHKYPKAACLYLADQFRIKSRQISSLLRTRSLNIRGQILMPSFKCLLGS